MALHYYHGVSLAVPTVGRAHHEDAVNRAVGSMHHHPGHCHTESGALEYFKKWACLNISRFQFN
jgi:hypothetical protein